jgi:hypothetical protein
MDTDSEETLCIFIQRSIATIEAAELLLILARDSARECEVEEIVHEIRPTVITDSQARKSLLLFRAQGPVVEKKDDRFQYEPASPALASAVSALVKAYNERPITLIRIITSTGKGVGERLSPFTGGLSRY